jgi:toxin ParE1/3/4
MKPRTGKHGRVISHTPMSSRSLPRVVSPRAQEDIEDILLFSARTWGNEQAVAYEAVIDQTLRQLAAFPGLGRRQDDVVPGCRSYSVERHVVYYRIEHQRVLIIRVLHQRMDIVDQFMETDPL